MKTTSLFYLFLLFSLCIYSQEKAKLKPDKIGFLINYGSEDNFIFNDTDYTYESVAIKGQAFYKLKNWKNLQLHLIVQPQVQFISHQLLNEQYITPDQEDYINKRIEFTAKKHLQMYGLEFGFGFSKKVTETLALYSTISLGFNYIDTRTERLAKGFTFLENFSLGLSRKVNEVSSLYLGCNFGHISNLNFKLPNDGYNILGLEIGYNFILN